MKRPEKANLETERRLLGRLVAQLLKHLTSAQVMISRFMSLSPVSGSVVTAQSLEPASDPLSPPLSALTPLVLSLSKMKH